MNINPYIQPAFAALAAGYVFADARRRQRLEEEEPHDDHWEGTTPLPLLWTFLTLLIPQIGLPIYLVRVTRFRGAAGAAALALLVTVGIFKIFPTVELSAPWQEKSVPWSRLPPGLPKAVREATERLSVDLATRVIDVLPGFVEVGRSYPGGADISVKPDEKEAQVLLEIHNEGFVEFAAVRIFKSPNDARKALAKDQNAKGAREVRTSLGEVGLQRGPERAKGATGGPHLVELFVRRDDIVFDLFLQESTPQGDQLTPARKAALESEIDRLMTKMSKAISAQE